jgi:hypothetical protein
MSPIGNLRYLTEDHLVLERCVETGGKDMCHDATASSWRHGRRPERGPYSPECVEKLSDKSRMASSRSSGRGPNNAASVVLAPFVPLNAVSQGDQHDLSDSFWKGYSAKLDFG